MTKNMYQADAGIRAIDSIISTQYTLDWNLAMKIDVYVTAGIQLTFHTPLTMLTNF